MSYRNISPEVMITISQRWLDSERDLPLLHALPLLRAFVPVLGRAHEGLISKQVQIHRIARALTNTQEQMKRADKEHDRRKRGVYHYLTALAELASGSDQAVAYIELRTRLLPQGLSETRRPYIEEIGDARRLRGRLDHDDWALMERLVTPDGTVKEHVEAWIAAVDELSRLDGHRAELERQRARGDGGVTTQAQAHQAKLLWIRTARGLEVNLGLEPAVTDEIRERLLGPLKQAEAQADRRVARRQAVTSTKSADDNDAAANPDITPSNNAPASNDGAASSGVAASPDPTASNDVANPDITPSNNAPASNDAAASSGVAASSDPTASNDVAAHRNDSFVTTISIAESASHSPAVVPRSASDLTAAVNESIGAPSG